MPVQKCLLAEILWGATSLGLFPSYFSLQVATFTLGENYKLLYAYDFSFVMHDCFCFFQEKVYVVCNKI